MTSLTKRSTVCIALMTMGMVLAPAAAEENGAPALPQGALGYVHVQLDELDTVPQMQVVIKLMEHVAAETSLLSIDRLGIDITTVSDVTIVAPPFASLMQSVASGDYQPLMLVRFSKSFRPRGFSQKLADWTTENVNGYSLYTRDEKAASMLVASNQMLVIGPKESVRWWVTTEANEGNGTLSNLLLQSESEGQLLFGVDMRQIPSQLVQQTFTSAPWIAKSTFFSLDIAVDNQIHMNGYFEFNRQQDAEDAKGELLKLGRVGLDELAKLESQMSSQVRDVDNTTAVASLFGLAVVRQCAEALENVEVSFDEVNTIVSAEIDNDVMLLSLLSSIGIQSIGANSKAQFDSISEQLKTQ